MVATTAFVLGFVVIGLGVVLVAMRGGPAGAARSAAQGRLLGTGVVTALAVAFGLGVPTVLAIGNGTAREDDGPGGVKLTAAEISGRQLFAQNCATCHTLRGAAATGRVGPNLDRLRPPRELTLDAVRLGRAQGRGQMPAQLLTGQDAEHVARFVAAVAGR